jgi:hypothetical protein
MVLLCRRRRRRSKKAIEAIPTNVPAAKARETSLVVLDEVMGAYSESINFK